LRGLPFVLPDETNWDLLLSLALSHGVLLLVHRSLLAIGVEAPDFFLDAVHRLRISAERLAENLEHLLAEFAERGIEVIPLKGPVLAQALYGDTSLRSSTDLDLLVRRRDFAGAEAILLDWGFVARRPSDYDRGFLRDRLAVELHHKIASPRYCQFNVDEIWSRSSLDRFRSQPIRVMCDDDLVLYLCAHGLKHGYSRLIWILDVARALRGRDQRGCEELMRRARRSGLAPWLLVGCEVVRRMFPQQLPEKMDAVIAASPRAAARARRAAERLFSEDQPIAVGDHCEFYLQSEPSALNRWSFRLGYLAPTPSDCLWAERHRLGRGFAILTRPFRLLLKYGPSRLWQSMFPPPA
jgi:hypothetical protein